MNSLTAVMSRPTPVFPEEAEALASIKIELDAAKKANKTTSHREDISGLQLKAAAYDAIKRNIKSTSWRHNPEQVKGTQAIIYGWIIPVETPERRRYYLTTHGEIWREKGDLRGGFVNKASSPERERICAVLKQMFA